MEVGSVYSQELPNPIHQRKDVLSVLRHLADLILSANQDHEQVDD